MDQEDQFKFKFSCWVPADLYLEFSRRAREKNMKQQHRTQGAITNAVIEAMEEWIENQKNTDIGG